MSAIDHSLDARRWHDQDFAGYFEPSAHKLAGHDGAISRAMGEVLDRLLRYQQLTQPDIVRQTGLSRASVNECVRRLRPLVTVDKSARSGNSEGGRPPHLVLLKPEAGWAMGIDFGHRFVRVALGNLSGRIVAQDQVRWVRGQTSSADFEAHPELAIEAAANLARRMLGPVKAQRLVGVAVSLPAQVLRFPSSVDVRIQYDERMSSWLGYDPAHELHHLLGWQTPFLLENDAQLGAVAELELGAAQGHRHVLYVKWSSSIGGAIIFNGRVQRGYEGVAGGIGHLLVPPTDEDTAEADMACPHCRSRRCAEAYAGADAIVRRVREVRPEIDSLIEVIDLARQSGPESLYARSALNDAARRLGRALGSALTLVNPEQVVIGGQMARASDDSFDPLSLVQQHLRRGIQESASPAALGRIKLRSGMRRFGAAEGGALVALREQFFDYAMRRLDDRAVDYAD
jgi:predicted NBD/HSP70 family sugar kinase